MRRTLVLIAAISLLLLPAGGVLADSGNPFQGSWIGPVPDEPDGSTNSLRVGGGNNRVMYQEDLLTACDEFTGNPLRGYLQGFATIEDGELSVIGDIYCVVPGTGLVASEKNGGQPFTLVFTDNGDGTLDGGGFCYHRPGRAADCED